MDDVTTTAPARTSRRNLVTAAAWAVPTIAVSAAAPLAAASTIPPCVPYADRSQYAFSLSVAGSKNFPLDPGYPAGNTYRVTPGTPIPVTTTFSYSGPQPLPAGATIKLAQANDAYRTWSVGITTISGAPAGSLSSPVAAGHDSVNDDASLTYTTLIPLPAGTVITFVSTNTAANAFAGSATYPLTRVTLVSACEGFPLNSRAVVNGKTDVDGGTPLWYYNVNN